METLTDWVKKLQRMRLPDLEDTPASYWEGKDPNYRKAGLKTPVSDCDEVPDPHCRWLHPKDMHDFNAQGMCRKCMCYFDRQGMLLLYICPM